MSNDRRETAHDRAARPGASASILDVESMEDCHLGEPPLRSSTPERRDS
jgi:hypothetical protein